MFYKYIFWGLLFLFSCCLEGKGFEEVYPVLFSHVNVYSGSLDFHPSSDIREYSSGWSPSSLFHYSSAQSTSLEEDFKASFKRRAGIEPVRFFHSSSMRGVPLQQGWHFLPQLVALLVEGSLGQFELWIKDPGGAIQHYHQTGGCDQRYYFGATQPSLYMPKSLGGGSVSCKETLLVLYEGNQTITVSFSNGCKRVYQKASRLKSRDPEIYYLLKKEEGNNGYVTHYSYDDQQRVRTIIQTTPMCKECARISFQYEYASRHGVDDLTIHVFAKDKRLASYFLTKLQREDEFALVGAENAQGVRESFLYTQLSTRKSLVLSEYYRGGNHLFSVVYDKDPNSKHYGKVLGVSYDVAGSMQKAFSLSYGNRQTIVQPSTGGVRIYNWLENGALAQVAFKDEEGGLIKAYQYSWEHNCLDSISLLDEKEALVAKKIYLYDSWGNTVEERLEGAIKGNLDKLRQVYQQNCCSWRYEYYPQTHLVKKAYQNGFLCTEYEYLPGTSLLKKQLSWHDGKIVYRKFWEYDQEHNLILAGEDDGGGSSLEDKQGVTQRTLTSYLWSSQFKLQEKCVSLEHPDSNDAILISKDCYFYAGDLLTHRDRYAAGGELLSRQEWGYDSWGRVVFEKNDLGRVSTWEYDSQGRVISCKLPGQPFIHFSYDAWGNVVEKRQGDGSFWEKFVHDVWGNIVIVSSYLGKVQCYYDTLNQCIEKRLPLVHDQEHQLHMPKYQFAYDAMGNQKKVIWPNGASESITYNVFGSPLSHENRLGKKTYYQYTLEGKLKEKHNFQGTRESFLYDAFGHVSLRQLFAGEYDLIEEELWCYNAFHLLSYKGPLGDRCYYLYNKLGQKCAVIEGKKTQTFSYDLHGNLIECFDGIQQRSVRYNSLGEILEEWVSLPSGKREGYKRIFYDTEGRKSLVLHQGNEVTFSETFHYDTMHRLIGYINPVGGVWAYQYENKSNIDGTVFQVYAEVDVEGGKVTTTKDALGRKVSEEKKNGLGEVISWEEFRYDKLGSCVQRLCSIYKGASKTGELSHKRVYNNQGDIVEEFFYPGKNKIRYFYDVKGNLERKILGNGIELYYQYDSLGHITDLSSSNGEIHYTYTYDRRGRLIAMKDVCAGIFWEREYGCLGYLQKERNSWGIDMSWEYDCYGNLTSMKLPDGSSVGYKYEEGRLQKLSRYNHQQQLSYAHIYAAFDSQGRVSIENFPGGVGVMVKRRDCLGRILNVRSPLYDWDAKYSSLGRLERVAHSHASTKEYSYDALGQVFSDGEKSYQFDSLGNSLQGVVDPCHQLTYHPDGIEVEYDVQGRVVSLENSQGESKKYYYDSLDRLTKISTASDTVHYQYDPLSRRASFWLESEGPRKRCFYLYDPEHEIGWVDTCKNIVALRVLGRGLKGDIGGIVCIELNNVPHIPVQDAQGNVIGLSSFDGVVLERYRYDIFGKGDLVSSLGNPWMYSSKSVEPFGEIFFGGRFYQPQLQRWLTPDPLGMIDGGNLYGYVQNDPINHVDVLGFAAEPIFCNRYAHISTELLPSSGEWAHREVEEQVNGFSMASFWGSNQWGNILLSQREMDMGVFNLWDHFSEFLQNSSSSCVTYGNGINTTYSDWVSMGELIGERAPSALVLSVYNPSCGLLHDLSRLAMECFRVQTPTVKTTAAFLHKVSKQMAELPEHRRWVHFPHSEHAVITQLSLDMLSNTVDVRDQIEICAVAPVLPLSKGYGRYVVNGYARDDYCVTPIGLGFKHRQGYNLIFRRSIASAAERCAGISDHFFASPSYVRIWENFLQKSDAVENF